MLTVAQQLGLDVLSGDQDQLGLGPGDLRGRHQVLALDHEQSAALALAVGAELPDLFQLLVVGAGDQACALQLLLVDELKRAARFCGTARER